MKFKYKFVWILILLGIVVFSTGAVFAASSNSQDVEVTVDGVDFILDDSTIVFFEDENKTFFEIGEGLGGLIESIDDEYVKSSIKNDTDSGYFVGKVNLNHTKIDTYTFVDGYESEGCFQFFKKDNKQFIFAIFNPNGWDDDAIEEMAHLMFQFDSDNKHIKPI